MVRTTSSGSACTTCIVLLDMPTKVSFFHAPDEFWAVLKARKGNISSIVAWRYGVPLGGHLMSELCQRRMHLVTVSSRPCASPKAVSLRSLSIQTVVTCG